MTFSYVLATHVLTIEVTDPPLPGAGEERAHWIDARTIAWPAAWAPTPADRARSRCTARRPVGSSRGGPRRRRAGRAHATTRRACTAAQLERFPALEGYLALRVPDGTPAAELLRGALLVTQAAADGTYQAATGVQIPGVLDDLYAGKAAKRTPGCDVEEGCPVARAVGSDGPEGRPARAVGAGDRPARRGAAAVRRLLDRGRHEVLGRARRYLWEVTVYAPTTDQVEVNLVTDPYSVALTLNSTHSVLVDLADKAFRPREWERAKQPVVRPVDQTIYELHVRDFSINDAKVPAAKRGTYLAFADATATAARTCATLEKAGLTTVHLLPTFDIASIQEDKALQETPDCDLASYAPDSDQQQACVTAVADADGFNWGYDPLHWTTPEGSYAVRRERRRPRRRVPHDGRRAARGRPAGGARPGVQPHHGQRAVAAVGAGPRGARLLPAAQRDRQRRDLDVLPEHRHRARDGAEGSWSTRW